MRPAPTFQDYACSDYLGSDLAQNGHFDSDAQYWIIVPLAETEELANSSGSALGFLRIGGPGVDGISFGYRKGKPGLWVYYPLEGQFVPAAASVQDLLRTWCSGELTV
jgi:hypothetical protein